MKIIGFAQLYNEESKGNLHNWIKSMSFCDYVYVYDQNSTDLSKDIYDKQDNFVVVESPFNNFKSEIKCKSYLLKKLLNEHPDVDWIFWMDGDTILSKNEGRKDIENMLLKYDQQGYGSINLRHFNLWRSDIHYRVDNEYDYLDRVGVRAFWIHLGQL